MGADILNHAIPDRTLKGRFSLHKFQTDPLPAVSRGLVTGVAAIMKEGSVWACRAGLSAGRGPSASCAPSSEIFHLDTHFAPLGSAVAELLLAASRHKSDPEHRYRPISD
ncbi:protein of unknown function [Methylorubrum extorquens]|uniref:Uncharacterized protein n=1 Tax=Methylorubrum extorquens TaxID=408 RepID=A0A2N9AMT3_METEX|nr:protein of unknown function [Methylorubrum extorquens]